MKQWIVLFSQPNKEFMVQRILESEHIETYLPTTQSARLRRDRRKEIPFFPRYLFARVDTSVVPISQLGWTPGISGVVSFGGKTAVIGQSVIDFIQRRVSQWNPEEYCGFRHGEVVRITDGPFRDLEAVFDRSQSASGRVRILLEVLGRTTACEIGIGQLERVN